MEASSSERRGLLLPLGRATLYKKLGDSLKKDYKESILH